MWARMSIYPEGYPRAVTCIVLGYISVCTSSKLQPMMDYIGPFGSSRTYVGGYILDAPRASKSGLAAFLAPEALFSHSLEGGSFVLVSQCMPPPMHPSYHRRILIMYYIAVQITENEHIEDLSKCYVSRLWPSTSTKKGHVVISNPLIGTFRPGQQVYLWALQDFGHLSELPSLSIAISRLRPLEPDPPPARHNGDSSTKTHHSRPSPPVILSPSMRKQHREVATTAPLALKGASRHEEDAGTPVAALLGSLQDGMFGPATDR